MIDSHRQSEQEETPRLFRVYPKGPHEFLVLGRRRAVFRWACGLLPRVLSTLNALDPLKELLGSSGFLMGSFLAVEVTS